MILNAQNMQVPEEQIPEAVVPAPISTSPGAIPFAEGMLQTTPPLEGDVPYATGMAPQIEEPIVQPIEAVAPTAQPIAPQAPTAPQATKPTQSTSQSKTYTPPPAPPKSPEEQAAEAASERLKAMEESADAARIKFEQESDDLAKQKIEPLSDMSVWGKIGLAIAAGVAGGLTGTDVMSDIIDRDIAKQKANLDVKKAGVEGKKTVYQELLTKYKDATIAEQGAKKIALDKADLKLRQMSERSRDENAKAQIDLMRQELSGKRDAAVGSLNEALAKQQSKLGYTPEQIAEVSKSDPVYAKVISMPDSKAKADLMESHSVYKTTEAAKKYIDDAYNQAKKIGGIAGSTPFSQSKATIDSFNAGIESAIRATMKGQGTIQEAEVERLVNPYLINPRDTEAVMKIKQNSLKQVLESKNEGQIGKLRSLGFLPKAPKTLKKND